MRIVLAAVLAGFLAAPVAAATYICRESEGVLRMSNTPCFAGGSGARTLPKAAVVPQSNGSSDKKSVPAKTSSLLSESLTSAKRVEATFLYEDGTRYTVLISPCELGRTLGCNNMRSCTEAYFFLDECGIGSLDDDKDGIPCESLCAPQKE